MKVCDYNHLILYAKGWYERQNVVEDVRKILAARYLLKLKYMRDRDVWACVVRALEKHCPQSMGRVMSKLFESAFGEEPHPLCPESTDVCPLSRAIGYVLTELSILPVKDNAGKSIIDLGDPDPNVLPLKKALGGMAEVD